MHTIKELSSILGLSIHQVRERVKTFETFGIDFKSYIRRGPNNRLLIDNNGLELLKRVSELEQTGKTVRESVDQIRHESGLLSTHKQSETAGETEAGHMDVARYIAHLEREIEFLRERVRELEAMLRPQLTGRVDPWWRRWFGRGER